MTDPTFLMVRNMSQASTIRGAIRRMLAEKKLASNYLTVEVTYEPHPDGSLGVIRYGYQLRVRRTRSKMVAPKIALELWAETREELLSDVNMATLLLLYHAER